MKNRDAKNRDAKNMVGAVLLDAFCVEFVSSAIAWPFRSGKTRKRRELFMFCDYVCKHGKQMTRTVWPSD